MTDHGIPKTDQSTSPIPPVQARRLAGYAVSDVSDALRSLADQVEALTKERDAEERSYTDATIDAIATLLDVRRVSEPLNYKAVEHAVDELLAERDELRAKLEEAKPISCSERLPEIGTQCLAYIYGWEHVEYCHEPNAWQSIRDYNLMWDLREPTHWMPLPKGPQS